MATWTVEITNVRTESRRATIDVIRTDGEDVRVYTLTQVSLDTHDHTPEEIRADILQRAKNAFAADEAERAEVVSLKAGWEGIAAADLNAWELEK